MVQKLDHHQDTREHESDGGKMKKLGSALLQEMTQIISIVGIFTVMSLFDFFCFVFFFPCKLFKVCF